MRKSQLLNNNWQFHLGELPIPPKKIAKKSYAFGGLTASLPTEGTDRLPISSGGEHFLRLIAQGDREIGLRNLCDTDLDSHLDEHWREVELPHDWKVELPYENNPRNLMSGSKADGVAYYRKRFNLDEEDVKKGNKILLQFEGIVGITDVWVNGAYLGRNHSAYSGFEYDLTELAYYSKEGTNTVLVRVDTTQGHEGWWYDGAGIYKNVCLLITPKLHLDADSFYIYTKSLTENEAVLGVEVSVVNDEDQSISLAPKVKLSSQEITFEKQVIHSGQEAKFTTELVVEMPHLWSPEDPYLYQASASIGDDQVTKEYGIRTFHYDTKGFYLNGKSYQLRGVCEHQDFAGVGVALNQDIVDYKVKVMKDMGVNAWRSAHHFASNELLSACDRLGIILMNENRLPEASAWRIEDLKKNILRSRMHACLAFWSIGNEELVGNTEFGSRTVGKLVKIVKSLNYEALIVSAELLSPEGGVDEAYLRNFDILGVNYPEAGVMGNGAEIIHKNHPELPMMSTENASYFSTRGIYKDNADLCQCNNLGSMYSMILPGKRQPGEPGVGGTASPERVMEYMRTHTYMGGVFLWTAFDYFGEPSPFGWPGIGSQFGIADSCGFPKDYYYYYKAQWTKEPMVHIASHWNKEGLEISERGTVPIRVFSNAHSVELVVNGQSLGELELIDCQAEWDVVYEEGFLEVRAFDQHHKLLVSELVETSGKIAQVQQKILYEGKDTSLIALEAVDALGRLVPTAVDLIRIEGPAIRGLGNGDPADISADSKEEIHLFSGKALVIKEGKTEVIRIKKVEE